MIRIVEHTKVLVMNRFVRILLRARLADHFKLLIRVRLLRLSQRREPPKSTTASVWRQFVWSDYYRGLE